MTDRILPPPDPIGVHLTHCYQGEYASICKYGDDDCPAKPEIETQTTGWQPIETAKHDLDVPIILARFRPGARSPDYVVMASWRTEMPGYIRSASYSGWAVDGVPLADPPRRKGIVFANGILDTNEFPPTHWMRLMKLAHD